MLEKLGDKALVTFKEMHVIIQIHFLEPWHGLDETGDIRQPTPILVAPDAIVGNVQKTRMLLLLLLLLPLLLLLLLLLLSNHGIREETNSCISNCTGTELQFL
jgi:hypothetical protein